MKPSDHEPCTWCRRAATFRVAYVVPGSPSRRGGHAFACELHIAEARRSLCIVRVAAVEVPS